MHSVCRSVMNLHNEVALVRLGETDCMGKIV